MRNLIETFIEFSLMGGVLVFGALFIIFMIALYLSPLVLMALGIYHLFIH